MAKAKKQTVAEVKDNEEAALEGLTALAGAAEVAGAGLFASAAELDEEEKGRPPTYADPEWDEFVMGLFAPHELDEKGKHPRVHGLRRLVGLLLGTVVESVPCQVNGPTIVAGSIQNPAVAVHRVTVHLKGPGAPLQDRGETVTYAGAADSHPINTDDFVARYATATADTRAEARALRKLLRIRAVAAEEIGAVPEVEKKWADGTQRNFLEVIGRRAGVNVKRLIEDGKKKHGYAGLDDMPYSVAATLCEVVSGYQTNADKIPDRYKGYEEGWENNR